MTRARDRLYVCGCNGGPAETLPPESWYRRISSVVEEIGKPHTDAEGRLIWRHEGFEPGSGEVPEPGAVATSPEPLPTWIDAPPPAETTPEVGMAGGTAQPFEAISPPAREGGENRRARGIHIHRLLEALPELAFSEREAAARRYLSAPVHGLDSDSIADILRSVIAVLNNSDFGDAFAPESLAEVSIVARVKLPGGSETAVAGRIDRLIVRRKDVLIIDYKTHRPPPSALDDVDPAYVEQLALYRLALQTLHSDKAVRAAILWTEAPKLMEIPGSAMERALHCRLARMGAGLDP
jgi:ATP-dependent helicase/nuclease subunit A